MQSSEGILLASHVSRLSSAATMTGVGQQHISPIQTLNLDTSSPPQSAGSSPSVSKKRSRSPLSIDLTSLPPLSSPAPPSNTLLITRLDDPKIFHAASIATIREHINSIAPLNSFSPLKSMHRIIVSFFNEQDAVKVRQQIDGTAFLSSSIAKCYFGEPTPIDNNTKYLDRPDAGRLFFISPPPSPPVGWEMRHEDPPNREVHAEDLASKLQRLTGRMETPEASPVEDIKMQYTSEDLQKLKTARSAALSGISEEVPSPSSASPMKGGRSRSSTLIYDPKVYGDSPALPAVMLETEDDGDVELETSKPIPMHTSRPPVELMDQ